jgi:hypothetical protein
VTKERLLERLDAIGQEVQRRGDALALLGLGSVGTELDRIDAYSDLDFFVIVQDGAQAGYIADLGWLQAVSPIAYAFQNSPHGSKVLFTDGIYAEYAVFTLAELAGMPFPEARIVWKAEGVSDQIRFPQQRFASPPRPLEELIGEIVTNLYVGLGRYHRGERLSAMRFIQGYAVDRILELAPRIATAQAGYRDVFGAERRFEQRFPTLAAELPRFTQGYDRSPESAVAILAFVERHWAINPAIKQAIVALLPTGVAAPGIADGSGETASQVT